MSDVTVSVEDDAVPIVKIMAARFRRASNNAEFSEAARAINGRIALQSSKDPQALTVSIERGALSLRRGIDKDADLVITLDLDSGETRSIKGWWRHPFIALRAGKLFDDYPSNWKDCARSFWDGAREMRGMPAGMHIRSTDDNTELVVGDDRNEVRIEGKSSELAAVFGGDAVFIDAVMKQRIRAVANMQHIATLSEATMLNLLGELS